MLLGSFVICITLSVKTTKPIKLIWENGLNLSDPLPEMSIWKLYKHACEYLEYHLVA